MCLESQLVNGSAGSGFQKKSANGKQKKIDFTQYNHNNTAYSNYLIIKIWRS